MKRKPAATGLPSFTAFNVPAASFGSSNQPNSLPVIRVVLLRRGCWKAAPLSGVETGKPLLPTVVAALMHSDVGDRLDLLVAVPIGVISSSNPSNTQ